MTKILLQMAFAAFALSGARAQAEIIAFENVNVITMEARGVRFHQRVTVDGDRIIAISPVGTPPVIKAARTIDCAGKFMIPGLIDTHYHQRGTAPKEYELLYKLLLANGITAVVSMGEDPGQDTIAIRAHANRDDVLAPVYYTVGAYLDDAILKTPADATEVVKRHRERGYDFIKVHGNLPLPVYLALLDEAAKAGIPVIGHAQRLMPLEYSLRMTHIAHMEEIVMVFSDDKDFRITDIDRFQAKRIARQIKDSGIYVSPTLSILAGIEDYTDDARFESLKKRPVTAYLSRDEYDNYTTPGKEYRSEFILSRKGIDGVAKLVKATRVLTRALYEAGVPLLVGSDNFGMQITGFSFHDEMEAMNKAGMPAYEVLHAATALSARYLGRQASAGTLGIGKKAEFVLLSKNPLVDIRNTRDVQGVMLKGRWLDRNALDEGLRDVAAARKLERQRRADR
ncbi:MAG TPA: amidohydrolase family protein [Duganella sp.]|nr:amidohydrolase family protein [Duganella sp.]